VIEEQSRIDLALCDIISESYLTVSNDSQLIEAGLTAYSYCSLWWIIGTMSATPEFVFQIRLL
jgi:hypothetical protein